MKFTSHTLPEFRDLFKELPQEVQEVAREAYRRFESDPYSPSLRFKHLDNPKLCSVHVKYDYRAVGRVKGNHIYWAWIGTKPDFERKFPKKRKKK